MESNREKSVNPVLGLICKPSYRFVPPTIGMARERPMIEEIRIVAFTKNDLRFPTGVDKPFSISNVLSDKSAIKSMKRLF